MLTRVHHVGLVVRRLEDGLAFWQDTLGLRIAKQATVQDQGVRAALLPIGRSEIELLEPIDAAGGVAKFLARRGEGLHHVCFETPDVTAELGLAPAAAEAAPGLTATAVTAGGVRLGFLSADPGSSSPDATALRQGLESTGEGLTALVLEVADLAATSRALGTPPDGAVHLDA